MANPATLVAERPPRPAPPSGDGSTQGPLVDINSFPRAADKRLKSFDERNLAFGTSAKQVGPISVAPIGFMRHIVIVIETDGTGVGTGATPTADFPWNVLQSVNLVDTAGQPLTLLQGYQLYQSNKRGGYFGFDDPAAYPSNVAMTGTGGEFSFKYRIPVEISAREGLGALPNQTSASTFKVNYTLAPEADVYLTSPLTTTPGVNVRCYLEAWSLPRDFDLNGIQNAVRPPNPGTTQMWSSSTVNVSAGQQSIVIDRVGNHIRNLGLIYRVAGVRNSADFPAEMRMEHDSKIKFEKSKLLWIDEMFEHYGTPADTGVFWIDMIHDMDGRAGHEARNLWLPTNSGTRLELNGIWGGAGGVLEVITNDVLVRDADIQAGV